MERRLGKKIIKASRDLQNRVGTGTISEDKIAAAQKLMDENETDFAPLAKPELDKLQEAITQAKKDSSDPEAVMKSFKTPIMNLKANAGAFNYGFLSTLTGTVLTFLENIEKPDRKIVQIVDVLHKTILLALAYQMRGNGGANGKILIQTFEDLCQKYKPPR